MKQSTLPTNTGESVMDVTSLKMLLIVDFVHVHFVLVVALPSRFAMSPPFVFPHLLFAWCSLASCHFLSVPLGVLPVCSALPPLFALDVAGDSWGNRFLLPAGLFVQLAT